MKTLTEDVLLREGLVDDRVPPLTAAEIRAGFAELRRWWRWYLGIGEYDADAFTTTERNKQP